MKRLVMAALVFAILAGCMLFIDSALVTASTSQASKPTSMIISWSSDGNPLVPLCNGRKVNCKNDITVLDKTTGQEVAVPITTLSYTISNPSDSYAVRVNGFNGRGARISSEYQMVPVE
jgi:hypothetical protein